MHCKTHWNAGMPYLPKELFIMLTETKRKKENKQLPAFSVLVSLVSYITEDPHRLAFTWRGCCRLCLWHKPTEFAHSCLVCSCVCFCLYGPFNYISFYELFRQLSAFSLCSSGLMFCLVGPFNYISLYDSLPQPWYNPPCWLGSKLVSWCFEPKSANQLIYYLAD